MSKVVVNDLSITSLETIMAFGINGGAHRFTLDELQNATIANSQDLSLIHISEPTRPY